MSQPLRQPQGAGEVLKLLACETACYMYSEQPENKWDLHIEEPFVYLGQGILIKNEKAYIP